MEQRVYDTRIADLITWQNLPEELQKRFTRYEVDTILEMKFLADDENVYQTVKLCGKKGLEVTEEEVQAVMKAEEVYLRMIGVID